MRFKTCNTGKVHETITWLTNGGMLTEMTRCGKALSAFTTVTPVSDDAPVTCQHCSGESALFGKRRKKRTVPG